MVVTDQITFVADRSSEVKGICDGEKDAVIFRSQPEEFVLIGLQVAEGGDDRMDQRLESASHVEKGRCSMAEQPFVIVRKVEIGLQRGQIQVDRSDSMCPRPPRSRCFVDESIGSTFEHRSERREWN